MENQEIYHVLPNNVLSVLDMFSTSKEGITLFASKVINEVEAGNIDSLKVKLYCKTMEAIADKIDKATIENQKTAAQKYGEKPFMFSGAELHYTATKTEYDYSGCNDVKLKEYESMLATVKAKIDKRKDWLKSMGGPENILDEATGETYTIYPPIKKSSMGVKCTIK